MIYICSKCFKISEGGDTKHLDDDCGCGAMKYSFCEDEFEDYVDNLEEFQEVFNELPDNEQALIRALEARASL